jgi:hypothetical protein
LIHILLVIATTSQVFFLNTSEGKHYRTHSLVFYKLFFNDDSYTDLGMERFQNIFTVDDLADKI